MTSSPERPVPVVTGRDPDDPIPLRRGIFLDVTTITVDPAYVQAAAVRAASGQEDRPHFAGRAGTALLVMIVALGLLAVTAVRQTRSKAPSELRTRTALVAEAERRARLTDALAVQRRTLAREADALRDRALRTSSRGRSVADDLDRLATAAAAVAVEGPGLQIRLADAESPGESNDDGRIHDRDLQEVLNALWEAGAQALAVNGLRVSSLTAVREAGDAVLVDYRPVRSPYTITALGDPGLLEPGFARSPTAARFRTWQDVYGLELSVRRRESVRLEAADITRLRHARPAGGEPTGAASGAPQ